MARVDRQPGAGLGHPRHPGDVGKIQARVDALGVEVQRQGHQIEVAAALAIAEQAALDPLRARQQCLLGTGHAGAAVVVRVDREQHMLAPRQAPVHPLDLVGEDIGGADLDGGRQVDDDRAPRPGVPGRDGGVADAQRHLQLGHAEGFRRILQHPLGLGMGLRQRLERLDMAHHQRLHLIHRELEHHLAPYRGDGVVQVHDHPPRAGHGLHGPLDEVVAQLGHHHRRDVVRDATLVDQLADDVEVGARGSGKAHFDFLEPQAHQLAEQAQLALAVHRFEQRLVTVAQVGGQPDRRLVQALLRPAPVRQIDRGERAVLAMRITQHDKASMENGEQRDLPCLRCRLPEAGIRGRSAARGGHAPSRTPAEAQGG